MNITLNGNPKQLTAAQNLAAIVSFYCKQPKHVIIELNGIIVPAEQWAETDIKEGDTLELVSFVGGG